MVTPNRNISGSNNKGRGNSLARGISNEPETDQPPLVSKVKRFALKPMSVAEAAEQMELLGHTFFLFINSENGKVSTIYQRKEGDLGLIEPNIG